MLMNLRPATENDVEPLARLHAESWRTAYRGMMRDAFLDGDVFTERLEVWRQRLSAPKSNQLVMVAEEDSTLLGFICAFGDEDAIWGTFIDNLHVKQERNREGIGRRLLDEVIQWSRATYPRRGLYLWVLERNSPARRFYESLGADCREVTPWQPPGGGVVTKLRYVWEWPVESKQSTCNGI